MKQSTNLETSGKLFAELFNNNLLILIDIPNGNLD